MTITTQSTDFVSQAMVLDGPGAMTRKTDPIESHIAADTAARTRVKVRGEILRLIFEHGPIDGQALNDLYARLHPLGDPLHVAYDSPRKRAGELVKAESVARLEGEIAANGLPAGAYLLTAEGLNEMEKAS